MGAVIPLTTTQSALACSQPGAWSVAAGFDLAANGVTSTGGTPVTVPDSLLKAIGWVESGWQQFRKEDTPLLSPDFGYGIMQITSGMAGAFGNVDGDLSPSMQSKIASEYRYNIAYGADILGQKWASTPAIGDRDRASLEDWYYAVWAYNGWGWVNNPNNPRFTRVGTPASAPATWPYQDRVFYLVAHPPHDHQGNPLWRPVRVWMPSRQLIGNQPGPYIPARIHHQPPQSLAAVYQPGKISRLVSGERTVVRVKLTNTGTQPWVTSGTTAEELTYHVFTMTGNPWRPVSPFDPGVVAFGQHPTPMPHEVLPGKSVTVSIPVQAPPRTGTYRIAWDLEEGAATWLSQLHVPVRATAVRVVSSLPTPTPMSATPTPRPEPTASLNYVADTAAPDGTQVQAGTQFTKGWLVFNAGTEAWTSGWKLVHVSGKSFGASAIAVPATASCHSANVKASLIAPSKAGSYTSTWQLRDPSGDRAGEKLTAVIQVLGNNPHPRPTPTPTATPHPHPKPTPTPTAVG